MADKDRGDNMSFVNEKAAVKAATNPKKKVEQDAPFTAIQANMIDDKVIEIRRRLGVKPDDSPVFDSVVRAAFKVWEQGRRKETAWGIVTEELYKELLGNSDE